MRSGARAADALAAPNASIHASTTATAAAAVLRSIVILRSISAVCVITNSNFGITWLCKRYASISPHFSVPGAPCAHRDSADGLQRGPGWCARRALPDRRLALVCSPENTNQANRP
jgi:hypothetical protein